MRSRLFESDRFDFLDLASPYLSEIREGFAKWFKDGGVKKLYEAFREERDKRAVTSAAESIRRFHRDGTGSLAHRVANFEARYALETCKGDVEETFTLRRRQKGKVYIENEYYCNLVNGTITTIEKFTKNPFAPLNEQMDEPIELIGQEKSAALHDLASVLRDPTVLSDLSYPAKGHIRAIAS